MWELVFLPLSSGIKRNSRVKEKREEREGDQRGEGEEITSPGSGIDPADSVQDPRGAPVNAVSPFYSQVFHTLGPLFSLLMQASEQTQSIPLDPPRNGSGGLWWF